MQNKVTSVVSVNHVLFQQHIIDDEEREYLKIILAGNDEPIYIHQDDVLFEYHLKNFNHLEKQLRHSWDYEENGND